MSWVADHTKALWLLTGLAATHAGADAQDLHVLVLGDSVSATCTQPARPPLRSTSGVCELDAFWHQIPNLHTPRGKTPVQFTPLIARSSSVSDWQPSKPMGVRLQGLIEHAVATGVRYDYAIWQHGARDRGIHRQTYFGHLFSLMKHVSSQIPVRRWLIATHSACGTPAYPPVARAQDQAGDFRLAHRYPGANLDTLPPGSWQAFGCGLTPVGETALAQRWAQAIAKSDEEAQQLEAESLLTLFRGLTASADP